MIPLPNRKYKVIYADPAWAFHNKKTGGSMCSGADAHYPTLSVGDICNLPVGRIAADDCAPFMWWVASQPEEAISVVKAWGFTLKTMTGFNWMKLTKTGRKCFGMGFWTRQGSENCLIAIKGRPKRVCASIRAVVEAENTRHSRKPQIFRDKIVELMGDVERVELFAREKAQGWDARGNEVPLAENAKEVTAALPPISRWEGCPNLL